LALAFISQTGTTLAETNLHGKFEFGVYFVVTQTDNPTFQSYSQFEPKDLRPNRTSYEKTDENSDSA
jgi:hypothetical protein